MGIKNYVQKKKKNILCKKKHLEQIQYIGKSAFQDVLLHRNSNVFFFLFLPFITFNMTTIGT